MKKIIFLTLIAFSFLSALPSSAQTISAEKKTKYYQVTSKPKTVTPAKKSLAPVVSIPASGTIIYSTPLVGIGGLAIQKGLNGWAATGTVNPSLTYSIGCGEYTTNPDGSLSIEPYVNVGAFVAAGVIPQSILAGSFQVDGSLGVYKYNNVAVGYDVLTKKPFIALGAQVSLFTFKRGLGSSIIHLF